MEEKAKNKKKRKKKAPVIILIVVVVIAVAAGYVWTTQKNNIEALINASGSSSEDIARQIEEQNAKTQETFSSLAGTELRALTDEEAEMLKNGEITEEEALALIMGEADADSEDASGGMSANTSSSANSGTDGGQGTETSSNSSSSNVSSLVAKAYVLKAEFSSEIDALVSQGYAEVASLPADERTTAKKLELMQKYSSLGSSLESSCDAKMEALLSELEAELERTDGDMGAVSEIRSSYEQEKSLKKAELISKYS